jgi:predicted TIM-barrel fold metal-dependent hydrolase
MTAIIGIDCHAHVFTRGLKMAEGRRYAPVYDATIADYLAMLDGNGMSHGVLVQPSFLGTDNGYMLEALRQARERLRGIAVVDPGISDAELGALDADGCVGVRLNLIGAPEPDFAATAWRRHLARIVGLRWQVEVQAEAARLPSLLPGLLDAGATVVVDHFGRPAGVDDPGLRYLLDVAETRDVWVKLSAPYRVDGGGTLLSTVVPMLLAAFGADRLMWGSDWPHTQHEAVANPAAARAALDSWLPDPAARHAVLVDTPAQRFRFVDAT